MTDRRQAIIDAGLAILGSEGLGGLTQPRVAARAKIRQSHLTYYFPTRHDLLMGVAQAATGRQIATLDGALDGGLAPERSIAALLVEKQNTRVLRALIRGADQEPEIRVLFQRLGEAMLRRSAAILGVDIGAHEHTAYLLYAVAIGLSILGGVGDENRLAAALETTITLLKGARE